jgi:hypothetical protein
VRNLYDPVSVARQHPELRHAQHRHNQSPGDGEGDKSP